MKPTIRIRGAGFSGLTLARELLLRGFPVEIHEARERTGGLISSHQTPLCLRETAANGLLANVDVETLCADLGVPLQPTRREARRRFIWVKGAARRWPLSFAGSLRLGWGLISRLWKGTRFLPHRGQSVAAWGREHLGEEVVQRLISPALQGIYAGDPERLSASLILSPFLSARARRPRGRFRGTVSPAQGMGQLVNALEKDVRDRGAQVHLQSAAEVRPSEIWVHATAAHDVPGLFPEMLGLSTVTLVFKNPQHRLQGFGCLFARNEGFRALGVLANDQIFEGRGPGVSETWIFGGAQDPLIDALTEKELTLLAQEERQRFYGGALEVSDEVHCVRYRKALPHYSLAWEEQVAQFRQGPQLYMTGNFLGRLGLTKILQQNKELAEQIARDHG